MNTTSKRLFVATVLAAAATLSMAQAPATPAAGGPGAGPGMGRMEHGDPAKRHAAMAERQAKHQAELKRSSRSRPPRKARGTTSPSP
jgi:Spy/CpxP family protein refolding chaperone